MHSRCSARRRSSRPAVPTGSTTSARRISGFCFIAVRFHRPARSVGSLLPHVVEVTTFVVEIPSDDMKGRIIGRNGRNIHAFEQAAGVDVIVDDTPEAVTISCFESVRREVARRALGKLIQDGRVRHPAHIEKILKAEQKEVDRSIIEAGEQAVFEANVPGLHPEVMKTLGRLRYRTSYGQNRAGSCSGNIKTGTLSSRRNWVRMSKSPELLLCSTTSARPLITTWKVRHSQLGAEIAKRYGVSPMVVNAIASHHHEIEQESVEAAIVEAADAISGARPGARRESLDQYLKRVRSLEEIANSANGVTQSYAFQAGREIRIFVRPDENLMILLQSKWPVKSLRRLKKVCSIRGRSRLL